MIVKVQISQFSSTGQRTMLIYDRSRSIRYEDIASKNVENVMAGRPKVFFNAELMSDGRVRLVSEAEWQDW